MRKTQPNYSRRDGGLLYAPEGIKGHPQKGNKRRKLRYRLRKYGLTIAAFYALIQAQDGGCAICGKRFSALREIAIDHDHDRGRRAVRGLLCNRCNLGLGALGDTLDGARRAVAYLEHAAALDGRAAEPRH